MTCKWLCEMLYERVAREENARSEDTTSAATVGGQRANNERIACLSSCAQTLRKFTCCAYLPLKLATRDLARESVLSQRATRMSRRNSGIRGRE